MYRAIYGWVSASVVGVEVYFWTPCIYVIVFLLAYLYHSGPELVLSQCIVNFNVLDVDETATKAIDITNVSDADAFYQVSLIYLFIHYFTYYFN